MKKTIELKGAKVRYVPEDYFKLSGPELQFLDWRKPRRGRHAPKLMAPIPADVTVTYGGEPWSNGGGTPVYSSSVLVHTRVPPDAPPYPVLLIEFDRGKAYVFARAGRLIGNSGPAGTEWLCADGFAEPHIVAMIDPPDPTAFI